MSHEAGPKEQAYDETIVPLLEQIQVICEDYGINYLAYFALDPVPDSDVIVHVRSSGVHDEDDVIGCVQVAKMLRVLSEGEHDIPDDDAPATENN